VAAGATALLDQRSTSVDCADGTRRDRPHGPAEHTGNAEDGLRERASSGADEGDTDDAPAFGEQLWMLVSQCDQRHAAHRVPDQDDRTTGGDRRQHCAEVTTELVDGCVLAR